MNRHLVGSINERSSIKIAHFVRIRFQTWSQQAILVSDWLISKKYFPLKLPSQMNHILVRSIYGKSSIRNAHFVSIRWQTWPPQAILVSGWLISEQSSPLNPLGQMNQHLVGSILRMSSMKIANFVPLC